MVLVDPFSLARHDSGGRDKDSCACYMLHAALNESHPLNSSYNNIINVVVSPRRSPPDTRSW